jgi:electron transport complex protein RnfC
LVLKKKRFSGGIYLKPRWSTDDLPVETLPALSHVTIPLIQHDGAPAEVTVQRGDHVAMGCRIGAAAVSSAVPVHASVSGIVTEIARYPYSAHRNAVSVTIENDGEHEFASPIPYDKPWHESSPEEIVEKIRLGGIVDNRQPLAERLLEGRAGGIETLLVNVLSPEGESAADARLIFEQPQKVMLGIAICKYIVGAAACVFAADEKRSGVVDAVTALLADETLRDYSLLRIKKARYPLGHERILVAACRGVELPAGASPSEAGCTVIGIEAAVAVAEAVTELTPSIWRIVTVAGPLVATPKNLLVPIGTPARCLLEACGTDISAMHKLLFGGLLSGRAVQDLETPITKAVSSLLPLPAAPTPAALPCIGCRRCRSVCPVRLEPARLSRLVAVEAFDELDAWFIHECIGCGCCAWVCPSGINLVQHIAYGRLQSDRIAGERAS